MRKRLTEKNNPGRVVIGVCVKNRFILPGHTCVKGTDTEIIVYHILFRFFHVCTFFFLFFQ